MANCTKDLPKKMWSVTELNVLKYNPRIKGVKTFLTFSFLIRNFQSFGLKWPEFMMGTSNTKTGHFMNYRKTLQKSLFYLEQTFKSVIAG